MLLFVEGKSILNKTFVLSCDVSHTVARVKSLVLHILHDIGRGDHLFRLRFGPSYLREPLTLQDYSIVDLSVLQMVPISFGRCARAQTAVGPRPFTTAGARQAGPAEASSFGARTVEALKREVSIFKRRERMLEALRALLWLQLVFTVGNFVSIFWWSGFWTGLLALVSLYFLPSFAHIGGSIGRMSHRDRLLMLLYGVGFLSAALGDIAMILYIVLSLIVPHCPPSSPHHNSDTAFSCSYRTWFTPPLLFLQTLALAASAILALLLRANFKFEAGKLVEPTLTQTRDIEELLEIARVGRLKDKREVTFELNNIALLGDQNKMQIAAAGGLQLLISLAAGEDEVTQEYATEAMAEMLTLPSVQPDFISQGGVGTLCALLHCHNDYVVEQAVYALSYITASCHHGNRMAVVEENRLDDLLLVAQKDISATQLAISKILHDLVSCDEAIGHVTSHDQLLDTLVERAGRDYVQTKLLTLRTLEQLAKKQPDVILDRPQLIPHLLESSLWDTPTQLSATRLLLVFAEDPEGSKQLLSHSNLLTSLQEMVPMATTTTSSVVVPTELPRLVSEVVTMVMKQVENRPRLVTLGVRNFLNTCHSRCSNLPDVQITLADCLQLLNYS